MRGVPFHNMPRDDPDYKSDPEMFARFSSPLWPRCIVGFFSTDALCVVITKLDVVPPFIGVPLDADWLRRALVGKDGETPLHKRLIEEPWPSYRGR
jgi:hypothetical protein